MRLLVLPAAFLFAVPAAGQPPVPQPDEVASLVKRLGSEDFAERESAARRLEDLGPAAIEELRAGAKSDSPETRRRAEELLRKAQRRLANEKALAPTLVELDLTDARLDDVLTELSKQARCDVVVGGLRPEQLADKKVTVSTGGKVPFWEAVLNVCDAADAQIASAGEYAAPGSMPPARTSLAGPGLVPPVGPARPSLPGPGPIAPLPPDLPPLPGTRPMPPPKQPGPGPAPKYRKAASVHTSVVLEARDGPRRPAAVYGAILVEAVELPKSVKPNDPSALLLVWPELRMLWQSTAAVKVARATDSGGGRLAAEYVPPGESGDMVLVRNPDGTAKFVRDPGGAFALPGTFRPNARLLLVRFKGGEKPAGAVKELQAALFGTVRGGFDPLSVASFTGPNQPANGKGDGAALTATYRDDGNGKLVATVELAYEPNAVAPAGAGDDLPGVKGGGAGFGNSCVCGVRVTDADGKPYTLGLIGGESQAEPGGKWTRTRLRLELHADKNGRGPPAEITFWGVYSRPVEVPVRLRDMVLSGGK